MKSIILLAALMAMACAPAKSPADRPGGDASAGPVLLVGNKGENSLSFIDLASGRELGRAPTGPMPHEIAISPDGRQAAVVAYGGHQIEIFDVASRAKVRTIDISPNQGPHGIVWLDDGRIVATAERSQSIVVIDTRRGDALSAISTGQPGSHMVVVTPDGDRAFTSNIPAGTVTALSLAEGTRIRDIEVGGNPEGITLTADGRELWVGDLEGARVVVHDARSLERLGEVRVGNVPIRVISSPDGRWIVTSNLGDGSLSVIDARTREVARTIPVSGSQEAAQVTILFSADGRYLYAAETGRNQVAEVDMATGQVVRRIAAGAQGDGLAIAPGRGR